ncbi:hypothetical protein PACID_15850 [Acidipropionibacterium acidipropionici ATCC 4875]|uniref:DUF1828 domain-containing protein n=1 Tax=Acidipropionibacterium acidipropionici (strain ATCC 4875 / DSM 20272 / JCM 6432 / NBRC 12425 / NCIMB 8070 / 4) TaxID=1171373 RepID=K7RWS3_ACIA4|nr:hypothetical protein [Acidipropionibacterium acidipropionici]AFV89398.1 hypothetical protein PACID_15850 [Acidipropionibacterium acidipropionici ATCC 4875]
MTETLEKYQAALTSRVSSVPCQGGELIATPFDFFDEVPLELLVSRIGDDHYLISDRGVVAERLLDASASIDSPSVGKSWDAIREDLAVTFAEVEDYELASTSTLEDIGDSLNLVAVKALQADELRVLGRTAKPKTFAERAIRQAQSFSLTVKPKARIQNRFGGDRQVSFSATGAEGTAFVMALNGGGSFVAEHDRALAAFSGVDDAARRRVSLISNRAKPLPWHVQQLESMSTIIYEDEQDDYWSELAAA